MRDDVNYRVLVGGSRPVINGTEIGALKIYMRKSISLNGNM